MFILTLAHFAMLAMRGGTMFYYFQYYVNQDKLFDLLQSLGLTGPHGNYLLNTFGLIVDAKRSNVASVGFSLLNMSSQFVTVVGVLCSTALSRRFGKKAVAIAGFSLTTVFMASFVLLPPEAIGATFLMEYIRALTYAPTIPLIWAMFADVADYSEWKVGRRATGIIFATIGFALKAGLSLGSASFLWLMALYGYKADAAKTPEVLQGIRLCSSVYIALLFAICTCLLLAYKLNKRLTIQIATELTERRKKLSQERLVSQPT